jgi:hypothetical protein
VYGEHLNGQIRPRSRFLEVPKSKSLIGTGVLRRKWLETLAKYRVLVFRNSLFRCCAHHATHPLSNVPP